MTDFSSEINEELQEDFNEEFLSHVKSILTLVEKSQSSDALLKEVTEVKKAIKSMNISGPNMVPFTTAIDNLTSAILTQPKSASNDIFIEKISILNTSIKKITDANSAITDQLSGIQKTLNSIESYMIDTKNAEYEMEVTRENFQIKKANFKRTK